jgi:hypothetical protein
MLIRKTAALTRVLPTFTFRFTENITWRKLNSPGGFAEDELLKMQKEVSFPMSL